MRSRLLVLLVLSVPAASFAGDNLYFDCSNPQNPIPELKLRLDAGSGHRVGRIENDRGYGELWSDVNETTATKKRVFHIEFGTEKQEQYLLYMPGDAADQDSFKVTTVRMKGEKKTGQWEYSCSGILPAPAVDGAELATIQQHFAKLKTPFTPAGTKMSFKALKDLSEGDAWKQQNHMYRTHQEFKPRTVEVTIGGAKYIAVTGNYDTVSELHVFTADGAFIASARSTEQKRKLTWEQN